MPQFLDVEDKIIGFITTRQFIILLAGALIIGISFKLFDFSLFVTFGLIMLAITGTVAFLKINGRPFHYFLLNLFQTFKRPKLRIWYFKPNDFDYKIEKVNSGPGSKISPEKRYSASRLAQLSLIVDTTGAYRGEGDSEMNISVAR